MASQSKIFETVSVLPLTLIGGSTLLLVSHLIISLSLLAFSLNEFKVWESALSFIAIVVFGNFFLLVSLQFIFSVQCINVRLSSMNENIKYTFGFMLKESLINYFFSKDFIT